MMAKAMAGAVKEVVTQVEAMTDADAMMDAMTEDEVASSAEAEVAS